MTCILHLLTAVINAVTLYARVFVIASHFYPNLDWPAEVGSLVGLHSKGRILALVENFRLVWKWLTEMNTLAYYDTVTIVAVKSFMI